MDRLTLNLDEFPHTQGVLNMPLTLSDGAIVEPELGGTGKEARAMVRELKFDICELPIVNYLSAREHGVRFTAIPVFLTRRFAQGMIICNRETGVTDPKDLEGKRVGIGYHGNTDTTWARGVLAHCFDVDIDTITWVASSEEQVLGATVPPNVEHLGSIAPYAGAPGSTIGQMLLEGDLAAVIYGLGPDVEGPGIVPLLGDVAAAEQAWFESTGIFPILHTIVVKDSVLDAHPTVVRDLLEAFTSAKTTAFEHLNSVGGLNPHEQDRARRSGFPESPSSTWSRAYLGADPLPYGIDANRENLEMIIQFAYGQHVTNKHCSVEELFATAGL